MTAVSLTATTYARSLTDRQLLIIPNGIDLKKYIFSATDKAPKDKKKNSFYRQA